MNEIELEDRLAERVGHNIAAVLRGLERRRPRIRKLAREARRTPESIAALADEIGNTPAPILEECGAFTIHCLAAMVERGDIVVGATL